MNAKQTHRPTATRIHADDAGVAAYFTARRLGATREQAMRAHAAAYANALRG